MEASLQNTLYATQTSDPDPASTPDVQFILPNEETPFTPSSGSRKEQAALQIQNWQGAKNYGESFTVSVSGGSTGGELRFVTGNCVVSPSSGVPGDTFTVTVNSAGAYTLSAILSGDGGYHDVSVSRSGFAGKADQQPLAVSGWGSAKDYYHRFRINVSGGTTNGTIHFECDGCTVEPASGTVATNYTVTVTRVGTYQLTAVMDGNKNYQNAYSTLHSGTSGKSEQAPIEINGWNDNARYGQSFSVQIIGGSSEEPLSVTPTGCLLNKLGGGEYEVVVNAVGPYSVKATRPGNYGYQEVSASACGISKQAYQPTLSVTGWSSSKNVSDSFQIHVKGGMSDGAVHFSTVGCSVAPQTGTVADSYTVTVTSVGTYSLVAFMDGTTNYFGANSTKLSGEANKALQNKLTVQNWDSNAASGDSFDIRLMGGNGTGAASVTTNEGCIAVLKDVATGTYSVTVTADGGEQYSLSASKSGDVNYKPAAEQTVHGTAGRARQAALLVSGWNDIASVGDSFIIHLSGGSGSGEVSFDTDGCSIVPAKGSIDDTFTVTITAASGNPYSMTVNRVGTSGFAHATMLKSGNVRPSALRTEVSDEMVLLGNGYEIWLYMSIFLFICTLLTGFFLFRESHKPKRHH